MAGITNQVSKYFRSVFGHLTIAQRSMIIGAVVLTIIGLILVVQWASKPDFVPLFSNLPPEEAGKIVDWLTENNIPYKLEQGGSRVLVPKENMYDARIRLAQEGLPSPRETGYEVFDATNLGMSEFVQKLNFRRALEGELARTIENMEEVERARVHIVIPEQALFRNKEKPTTSSVVLKLRNRLSESQVTGIAHLVASAVEGLEIEKVAILDTRGNLLSKYSETDPLVAMSSTQLQLKEATEASLAHKVETMLTRLLGEGKAIVRISVDLDFSRTEITEELYDPEQTAVRSEESVETEQSTTDQSYETNADPNAPKIGTNTSGSEVNTVTNYEISKTLRNTVSQAGGIQRVSAAIMIDGTYENVPAPEGKGQIVQYHPRTDEEIDQIALAVRNALGYNEQRGDEVSVINIPFQAEPLEEPKVNIIDYVQQNWYSLLQKILFGVALLFGLLFLKRFLQKSAEATQLIYKRELTALPKPPKPVGALPAPEEQVAVPAVDSEMPMEVRKARVLQQQLIDYVEEKPETAARLLRSWLVEG